ncbi:hypothetical protein GJV04_14955 [Enterobacteriaceae bacterium RIT714]|nr:hypothetical protein [Enterobacteriaceae bacterium RIT714]
MKNIDIKKFLKTYIELKKNPGYGVLLSGKWGVGKTHFINEIITSMPSRRFLHVSLYGINKTSQINDEFFKLLHPVLGGKISKFAERAFKLATKAAFKIDIDKDGKEDANIEMQIPSFNLSELIKLSDNCIIIFDDIERSGIELPIIFGYINHLIEYENMKLIIIGNESVLHEKFPEYKSIKEKTIGKTFLISPDFKSAIKSFTSFVSSRFVSNLLTSKKDMILELFIASGHQNLRFLKQFFIEFEILISALGSTTGNNLFLDSLLKQYLIYCIEHKNGDLDEDDFDEIDKSLSYKSETDTKISKLRTKYQYIEDFKGIMNADTWKNIVIHGFIDKDSIVKQIEESIFFKSSHRSMPIWRMLWEYRSLSDQDFDHAVQQAKNILTKDHPMYIGEIIHITASLIKFSKEQAIDISIDEIISLADKALFEIIMNAKYDIETDSYSCGSNFINTWNSHYYIDHESDEVIEITELATNYLKIKKKQEQKNQADILAASLSTDPDLFIRELYYNPSGKTSLYETPFLTLIKVDDFVEKMIKLSPKDRSKLMAGLTKRYAPGSSFRNLTAEKKWLNALSIACQDVINTTKGATKLFVIEFLRYALKQSLIQLEIAVKELEEIKK